MPATATTIYNSFSRVTPQAAPSPRLLAKAFAAKYLAEYRQIDGFACVKHAAASVFTSPTISVTPDKMISVIVSKDDAAKLSGVATLLKALVPGTTTCEMPERSVITRGRLSVELERRRLDVRLPEAALSDNAIYGVIDYLLTHLDRDEVERTLAAFAFDADSFLVACNERDRRVNAVIGSLFDAMIVDEFGASRIREAYADHTQEQFVFAVQTRHDGGFYRMVAELFMEYVEE